MEKKRRMSADKFQELNPDSLADLYMNRPSRKRVVIDGLLNQLEDMRNEYIEQALELSDLREAKELINYIKNK